MALTESIIFSDPVLGRIFFDDRRFAPRMKSSAAVVINHWHAISEYKILFQKVKGPAVAEYYQRKMRARWFAARKLCDGYFIDLPAGHSDGCEHVRLFAHDAGGREFEINANARAAYWYKYAGRTPPAWGTADADKYQPRRRRQRRRRI